MSEIDGSKCEHIWISSNKKECLAYQDFCVNRPDCYYRQLHQLKKENEELKERLNCNCFDPKNNNNRCISYNRIAEDYERDLRQLDQLKAKNDELKDKNNAIHTIADDLQKRNHNLTLENEELKKEVNST